MLKNHGEPSSNQEHSTVRSDSTDCIITGQSMHIATSRKQNSARTHQWTNLQQHKHQSWKTTFQQNCKIHTFSLPQFKQELKYK